MNKRINPLLLIGLIGTLTIGTSLIANLYHAFWGAHDIWWTPEAMSLPIEETRNHFALSIGRKSLQKHLSEGTLFAVDNNGEQYPIVSKDVTIRLNNWDNVKASILKNAIISSFVLGVAVTLLITGLIQVLVQNKKSS